MCGCNNHKFYHPTRPTGPVCPPRPTYDPADPLNLGPLEPCAGVGTYKNMPALGGMVLIACERPATPGAAAGWPAQPMPGGFQVQQLPAGGFGVQRRPSMEL